MNVQTFASTAAETSGVEPELAPDPAVATLKPNRLRHRAQVFIGSFHTSG